MQARHQLQAHLTSFTDHRVVFSFESGKVRSAVELRVPVPRPGQARTPQQATASAAPG